MMTIRPALLLLAAALPLCAQSKPQYEIYAVRYAAAGTVVLASDNMYLYGNPDKHAPIGSTLDAASNLRAQDRMKQLAADSKLIIPRHDPAVMTRFESVAPGVVRIK